MGQISSLFTYVGEFQPVRFQKRVLSWLSFFMGIGLIILPRKCTKRNGNGTQAVI